MAVIFVFMLSIVARFIPKLPQICSSMSLKLKQTDVYLAFKTLDF